MLTVLIFPPVAEEGEAMPLEAGGSQVHFELWMQIIIRSFWCVLPFLLSISTFCFYHLSLNNFAALTFIFLLFSVSTTKTKLEKDQEKKVQDCLLPNIFPSCLHCYLSSLLGCLWHLNRMKMCLQKGNLLY